METLMENEIIETDEDTKDVDPYDASLYPYPSDFDIDDIEIDVREVPFTVYELVRHYRKNRLIIDPEFQRNRVWDLKQMSWFVESIILNIPLPQLFLNQDKKGKYIVVDGLQRITTIYDFLNDNFALQDLEALPWLNGKRFSDLKDLRSRIEDRKLPSYVIRPSVPLKMIYDIFKRINTGGTQLSRQEIRNCIFLGKSTRLLHESASMECFKKAIGYGIGNKRMKDREAVLRCITFQVLDYEKEYNNDMDEFLGHAMKKINLEMDDQEVKCLKDDFRRVMDWTFDFFGQRNFRIPTYSSRGRINIAVMESVSYFFYSKDDDYLKEHKEKIISNFNLLVRDPEYLNAVKVSTGDRKRVVARFAIANKILGDV